MLPIKYLRQKFDEVDWETISSMFNAWVGNTAIFMTLIGYAILFNDAIAPHLSFSNFLGHKQVLNFAGGERLRITYFSLFALTIANIIYYLRRPAIMKIGVTEFLYVRSAFDNFLGDDYLAILWHENFRPVSVEVSEFQNQMGQDRKMFVGGNWARYKLVNEGTLRATLRENWGMQIRSRKFWQIACGLFAVLGYLLLFLLSADLFVGVVKATVNL